MSLVAVIGCNIAAPRGLDRNLLRAFLVLEDCTIVLPRDLDLDFARILPVLTELRDLLGFAGESLRELVNREDNGLTPVWRTMAMKEIVTAMSPYTICTAMFSKVIIS